jgi:predicted DNA-binding transcriptional regulator YafY
MSRPGQIPAASTGTLGDVTATDPASRLLKLLALLQTGRSWPGPDLTRRLTISPRTLRRDVDRLRKLGYTVTTRPGPGGSYRLAAGAAVPTLLFDDAEVTALVGGLRLVESQLADGDAAQRALIRLRQVLPSRLRPQASSTNQVLEVVDLDARPADAGIIAALPDAAPHDGRVCFTYRDRLGVATTREVDPHRQVHRAGRWYLLGVDAGVDDWRVFRLDRITDLERLPGSYPRRELPAATAGAYFGSNLHQPGTAVPVVFEATPARLADRLPRVDGHLVPLPEGRCRYLTRVDDLAWFAATTAVLGIPFVVETPAELASHCRDLARVLLHASVRAAEPPAPASIVAVGPRVILCGRLAEWWQWWGFYSARLSLDESRGAGRRLVRRGPEVGDLGQETVDDPHEDQRRRELALSVDGHLEAGCAAGVVGVHLRQPQVPHVGVLPVPPQIRVAAPHHLPRLGHPVDDLGVQNLFHPVPVPSLQPLHVGADQIEDAGRHDDEAPGLSIRTIPRSQAVDGLATRWPSRDFSPAVPASRGGSRDITGAPPGRSAAGSYGPTYFLRRSAARFPGSGAAGSLARPATRTSSGWRRR